MPNQFENTKKLEDATLWKISAEQRSERISDKATRKDSNAEQRANQDHTFFSN